ncbi:MAG: hypothetical protein KC505_11430, partial [Myxococcales bacterium]|nr:hypothetical protein [Myxococcales bacterium]
MRVVWLFSLVSILFLFSCEDHPYEEPREGREFKLVGTAELGNPVTNSTIAAYKFQNLREGEKLAEVTTNRDGSFELKVKTNYRGPVLLKASEGFYEDLVTKEKVYLKPKQELKSLIEEISVPEPSNINAWTTLAVARVKAKSGFWDPKIRRLSEADRINEDFHQISKLLAGKSVKYINFKRLKSIYNADETVETDKQRELLFLTHGGFSQLAKNYSDQLEGYPVTILDVIEALENDLTDRIFNGRSLSGGVIQLGNVQRLGLSSQTMRKHFAEAVIVFMRKTENEKIRLQSDAYRQFAVDIASGEMPELFPESEKPRPIDTTPPEITVSFESGEVAKEEPFALMEGAVSFRVKAEDDTKLEKIKVFSPGISFSEENGILGPVDVNYTQNSEEVAKVCKKQVEFAEQLELRGLSEQHVVCACFEANDIFDNKQRTLSCFQRGELKASIEFPKENRILTSKDFSDGVSIKAQVTSGVTIDVCDWKIMNESQMVQEDVLEGSGSIESNGCIIEVPLFRENFSNGIYHFVVHARDIYGRELSYSSKYKDGDTHMILFEVAIEPPVTRLIIPQENEFTNGNFIEIQGTYIESNKIQKITVSYQGTSEDNQDYFGSYEVPMSSETKTDIWRAELGANLSEGEYELNMLVTDIYGNQRTQTRKIIIDRTAPTVKELHDDISTLIVGHKRGFINPDNT